MVALVGAVVALLGAENNGDEAKCAVLFNGHVAKVTPGSQRSSYPSKTIANAKGSRVQSTARVAVDAAQLNPPAKPAAYEMDKDGDDDGEGDEGTAARATARTMVGGITVGVVVGDGVTDRERVTVRDEDSVAVAVEERESDGEGVSDPDGVTVCVWRRICTRRCAIDWSRRVLSTTYVNTSNNSYLSVRATTAGCAASTVYVKEPFFAITNDPYRPVRNKGFTALTAVSLTESRRTSPPWGSLSSPGGSWRMFPRALKPTATLTVATSSWVITGTCVGVAVGVRDGEAVAVGVTVAETDAETVRVLLRDGVTVAVRDGV